MLLDPRYISRGILDGGAMKSETTAQLPQTYSNSSRRHLVRYISRGILERGAMKSETAAQLAETYSNSSRRHLVCQWLRTAEGLLVCAWHHDSPTRAEGSHQHVPADSLESKMGAAAAKREPEEVSLPAAPTSAYIGTLVPPARPQRGAQAIIQGFAIALLLALTGLETVMCFAAQGSGLF